jgi:hypothetical protein
MPPCQVCCWLGSEVGALVLLSSWIQFVPGVVGVCFCEVVLS